MEQQNQFDNLHVQAMALADSALSHIAETTACTDAQNSRILQQTLEKAGIEQTQHIKQHPVHHGKRRLRMLAAAAAAAVTVVVAALGVSGRLTYNKPLAERNFGILGAARLEELNLPKPVTYIAACARRKPGKAQKRAVFLLAKKGPLCQPQSRDAHTSGETPAHQLSHLVRVHVGQEEALGVLDQDLVLQALHPAPVDMLGIGEGQRLQLAPVKGI